MNISNPCLFASKLVYLKDISLDIMNYLNSSLSLSPRHSIILFIFVISDYNEYSFPSGFRNPIYCLSFSVFSSCCTNSSSQRHISELQSRKFISFMGDLGIAMSIFNVSDIRFYFSSSIMVLFPEGCFMIIIV